MKGYNARYVWMISAVAAMGGLLFGYDWVVIGGAKPFYEQMLSTHQRTAESAGPTVARCWDACSGRSLPAAAERPIRPQETADPVRASVRRLLRAHRLGRPRSRGSSSGASWAAWPSAWPRTSRPMYIAEVSPARMRGRLVSINQLTIVIGILAAQIVNWLIAAAGARGRHRRDDPPVLERAIRLALDVHRGGRALAGLLLRRVVRAGKPALAGRRTDATRSRAPHSGAHRRRRLRRAGVAEIRGTLGAEIGACGLRELLEPGMLRSSRHRRRPGRAPAVERHQRDLQLRRGDLPRRGLRRQRHPLQHRDHRHRQPGVHLRRARLGRPPRPPRADAGRLRRHRRVHTLLGLGLPLRTQGPARAGAHAGTIACYACRWRR